MKKRGIKCVPIIDGNKKPIDLICLDDFENQKPSKVRVIIMAEAKALG